MFAASTRELVPVLGNGPRQFFCLALEFPSLLIEPHECWCLALIFKHVQAVSVGVFALVLQTIAEDKCFSHKAVCLKQPKVVLLWWWLCTVNKTWNWAQHHLKTSGITLGNNVVKLDHSESKMLWVLTAGRALQGGWPWGRGPVRRGRGAAGGSRGLLEAAWRRRERHARLTSTVRQEELFAQLRVRATSRCKRCIFKINLSVGTSTKLSPVILILFLTWYQGNSLFCMLRSAKKTGDLHFLPDPLTFTSPVLGKIKRAKVNIERWDALSLVLLRYIESFNQTCLLRDCWSNLEKS